jgi:hypothetical protein
MNKLLNGVLVALTPEEEAGILAQRQAAADAAAASTPERQRLAEQQALSKADVQIASLRAMTPAQFDAWFDALTNAQLRELVKRLTRLVLFRLLK